MNKKPIIGILAARMQSELDILDKVATTYTDSIVSAGGIPIILSNIAAILPHYIKLIDGVLMIGGSQDIDPSLYNEKNTNSKDTDIKKDRYELKLIKACINACIPIFGICRGMQLINLHFGGSLIQDLPNSQINHLQYQKQFQHVHKISVKKSRVLLSSDYSVNSVHHQAIKKTGTDLQVSAYSEDGIIEMIEHKSLPIIGVQWHPECLFDDEISQQLFQYFINHSASSSK